MKKHAVALALLLCLAVAGKAFGTDFAYNVAARCKGEAPHAIPDCTCTVKWRLVYGWSQARVLDAYYAADATPTDAEAALARAILTTPGRCPVEIYFMFSRSDTHYLGISHIEPVKKVVGPTGESWFYEYDFMDRDES